MKPTPITTPGQRLAEFLEDEFPEKRIAQGLSEIAAATLTTRAGTVEPDYRTRLAALQTALAYRIGKPIERQEIVTVSADVDNAIGLADRLSNSPALRSMMKKMLDRAEGPTLNV